MNIVCLFVGLYSQGVEYWIKSEQCPIALYMTVLQNHTQYNHNQVLIEIKALYKRNKTFLSAPHVVLDTTFIRSSDLVQLFFKDVKCGINK